MQEHKPLYLYSREEALRHGERDQWRNSYRENCDCARAIERAIAENYRDNCLGNCAGSILDRYGFTRVNWVLANTIQQKSYDGRFSEDNKRWARQFYIPNDDIRWHFTVESHPGLTNLFVEQVLDAWQSLGLFDASHCLPDDNDQDYRCDVKRVTTINYDRNVIRRELGKLNKASDETSAKLDLCLVTSTVDYEPPFDVNDSFADAFERFMEKAGA